MHWADGFPNLLIGLREGLEAGLVVSILLAAVRRSPTKVDGAAGLVWLGVAGAVSLAASFAAVLTFTTAELASTAQEAIGGALSVLAVALVTGMIFWMRRSAATLSARLKGDVSRAMDIGPVALAVTGFLAVGREGLETTLFLWTAVKASGSTLAPLVGAALGIVVAVVLCVLMYRQAVRINLAKFFRSTAVVLIVLAAGVLAYGLGDLQDAGLVPGQKWVAFDLTGHIDAGSWWVALVSGVTELRPSMTVLQVTAWLVYLTVVLWCFVRPDPKARPAAAPAQKAEAAAIDAAGAGDADGGPGWWERLAGKRRWVTGVVVVAPIAIAGGVIGVIPSQASASTDVSVTPTACAPEWTSMTAGTTTFAVDNQTDQPGEITLTNASGGIIAEIETLGPATTATMTARLGAGTYQFHCHLSGGTTTGPEATVTGRTGGRTAPAVIPVTVAELTPANNAYRRYAAGQLRDLAARVAALRHDMAVGDRSAARRDWLDAQLDWERVGASYDSFGDLGLAVDGLPDGPPKGVADPHFVGLHRIEYGLFDGQPLPRLVPIADRLAGAVRKVRGNLGSDDLAGDPTNLPVRAHEILEDALRDHLSGIDDGGSHAAYPMTYADTQVTRRVLTDLRPLIQARKPGLTATMNQQLTTLQRALSATRRDGMWSARTATPLRQRQAVHAALGALLENLAQVPDLLEVPPTH